MASTSNDLYKILGVDPSASGDEIRSAFRARAKGLHPDVNPENPSSEEAFKRLSAAFSILSKPKERRLYDLLRSPSDRNRRTATQTDRPTKTLFRKFAYSILAGSAAAGITVTIIAGLNIQVTKDLLQFANAVRQDFNDSVASPKTNAVLKKNTATASAGSKENRIAKTYQHKAFAEISGSLHHSKIAPPSKPQRPPTIAIANEMAAGNSGEERPKSQVTAVKPKTAKVRPVKTVAKPKGRPINRQIVAQKREIKPKKRQETRSKHRKRGAMPQKKNTRNPVHRAVRAAILKQVAAFRKDDGAAAFALAAPNIQERFHDATSFMKMVAKSYPQVYRPKKVVFLSLTKKAGNIIQRVLLRGSDRRSVIAHYSLVRINGLWRISGCEFKQRDRRI